MLTGLIMQFIVCVYTATGYDSCVDILDEIAAEETQEEINNNRIITHLGYSKDSHIQDIVEYAYLLGGIDLVTLIECENGRWTLDGTSDHGHSHGLCMINDRWHKIPNGFYDDFTVQVDYCYDLYKGGTKFYGPNRKIKGVKCKDYVLNRFEINDTEDNKKTR